MAERPIESLTPREKFSEASRSIRELLEHLEQAVLPKVQDFRRNTRWEENDPSQVTDLTIRKLAEELIRRDDYTRQVGSRLTPILESLAKDLKNITEVGQRR